MFLFRFFGLTFLGDKYQRKFRIINLSWIIINISAFVFLIVAPSTSIFSRSFSKISQIIEIANYIFVLATNLLILVHVQMVNEQDVMWHGKLGQMDLLLREKFNVTINHRANGRWRFWKVWIMFIGAGACS